eukprot:scaffold17457_cov105-Isochrysis_galbana.AAC.12
MLDRGGWLLRRGAGHPWRRRLRHLGSYFERLGRPSGAFLRLGLGRTRPGGIGRLELEREIAHRHLAVPDGLPLSLLPRAAQVQVEEQERQPAKRQRNRVDGEVSRLVGGVARPPAYTPPPRAAPGRPTIAPAHPPCAMPCIAEACSRAARCGRKSASRSRGRRMRPARPARPGWTWPPPSQPAKSALACRAATEGRTSPAPRRRRCGSSRSAECRRARRGRTGTERRRTVTTAACERRRGRWTRRARRRKSR